MVHGSAAYLLRPLKVQEVADTLEKLQPFSDPSLEKAVEALAAGFRRENVNFTALGKAALSDQADITQWQALYDAAVEGIYQRYPWLALYHHPKDYALSDLSGDFSQQCQDQLKKLQNALLVLYPVTTDSQMDEILTFLLQNIDQDLPQKEVAKQFYMVGSTLSTRFQRHLGICYREYTTRLKILRAQYLLQHTGLTDAEVSAQLGYKDRDYFNQLFLHRTGQTPQQVRLIG
jgi:AraC-like DNA-binding protein